MTRAQSTESELLAAVRKAARQEQFLEVMSAEDARRRFENNLNLSPLPGERDQNFRLRTDDATERGILIAATAGIGYLILYAGDLMQTSRLLAGIVVLSVLGLLSTAGLAALERRLFEAGRAVAVLDGQSLRTGISRDLGFSAEIFGLGSGIFFFGYLLLEIPGSVLVERWSARKWIARIMITWGLLAVVMAGIVMVSSSDIVLIYVPLLGAERHIDDQPRFLADDVLVGPLQSHEPRVVGGEFADEVRRGGHGFSFRGAGAAGHQLHFLEFLALHHQSVADRGGADRTPSRAGTGAWPR